MARPKKQEVDYFPHYCDHGKVLFILENHFKNDGYAVFYKLEELLSKTEGHCYDCSRLENWEYLLSRMGATEEIVTGVIEKLSAMAVLDAPLWKEKRIWMQSFVDSISDAYSRRRVDLPTRPELMLPLIRLSGVNDDINPQSKVKESKVKYILPKAEKISFSHEERKFYGITKDHFASWEPAYPAVSIDTELAGMEVWLLANPKNRKSNYERFISNWLKSAQDKAARA